MFGRSLSETMQVEARLGGQFVPILLHRCVNFLRDHGERWWSVTAHGFGMRLGWVVCYRSFGNSLSVGHRLNMNIQSCVLIIMASWSRLWWLTDILYIVTVYSSSVSSGLGFLSVFLYYTFARYQSSFSHLEETTNWICTLHHVCMDWYMTMITFHMQVSRRLAYSDYQARPVVSTHSKRLTTVVPRKTSPPRRIFTQWPLCSSSTSESCQSQSYLTCTMRASSKQHDVSNCLRN